MQVCRMWRNGDTDPMRLRGASQGAGPFFPWVPGGGWVEGGDPFFSVVRAAGKSGPAPGGAPRGRKGRPLVGRFEGGRGADPSFPRVPGWSVNPWALCSARRGRPFLPPGARPGADLFRAVLNGLPPPLAGYS